jgi:hypothetical protein
MQSSRMSQKSNETSRMPRRRRVAAALFGLLALETADLSRALAVCPDTPGQCLGDAAHFSIVTEGKLKLGSAFLSDGGTFWAPTTIHGAVCADRVAATSPPPGSAGAAITTADDIAVLAGSGTGVTASTVGSNGPDSVGLEAALIATGGSLVGPRVTFSAVDTTGAHPLVDRCRGAHPDAIAAAATLGALPSTGDLGNLNVAEDENRTIVLASGLNVLDADAVRLDRDAELRFQNGGGATWAVVRTKSLRTSILGDINSSVPLIFVLAGKGPAVTIGRFSDLRSVGILAPGRSVKIQGEGYVDGLWARKAILTGVDCLPSGLFGP